VQHSLLLQIIIIIIIISIIIITAFSMKKYWVKMSGEMSGEIRVHV